MDLLIFLYWLYHISFLEALEAIAISFSYAVFDGEKAGEEMSGNTQHPWTPFLSHEIALSGGFGTCSLPTDLLH